MISPAGARLETAVALVLTAVVCVLEKASAQRQLEIDYGQLSPHLHRARGSNVIYGDSKLRLVLGCMLPPWTSVEDQEKERYSLKWRKDGDFEICGSRFFRKACSWEDYLFARGAQMVHFQLNEDDQPSNGVLGSGSYTCYHTTDRSAPVSTRVWVAGKYLEILVNGLVSQNKTHQLPTKATRSDEKSFVLECILGAGAKGLASDAKIQWYRDTKLITASEKYALDESGKKLEIRKANGRDEGVYMCKTTVLVQNQGATNTLQYVILQGGETSSAHAKWRHQLLNAHSLLLALASILATKRAHIL